MRLDAVQKLLAPLRARIANMVARAVVRLADDGGKLQVVQLGVGADETRDGVERFQEYGFTSVPLSGAEAVVVFVGGRRDHGLAVAVDDRRYRPTGMQPGEVSVYTNAGQHVLLKADGTVEIGGGTMQPAALGQDVRDELDALWQAVTSHGHAVMGVTAGSNTVVCSTTSGATVGARDNLNAFIGSTKKTVKSATVKVKT